MKKWESRSFEPGGILIITALFLIVSVAGGATCADVGARAPVGVVKPYPLNPSLVEVYFSKSVDTYYAAPKAAQGDVDLEGKLLELLADSKHSVDMCVYSLTRTEIADEILNAWDKNVNLRFIVEDENRDSEQIQALETSGITVIDDTFGSNNGYYLMHNKFIVVDNRIGAFEDDDAVWTGSYNLTYYGGYVNAENAVVIRDHDLGSIYTDEFDEMWGGSGDEPDEAFARFGQRKYDNTEHYFSFNGGQDNGSVYFAPSDQTTRKILDAIDTADYEIYFCIYSFTRSDIASELHYRYMQGAEVIGVFDGSCVSYPEDCQYDEMDSWGMEVYEDGLSSGSLHHKYMVIDGFHPDSDPMVVTGSHNWTTSGGYYNDENLIILEDPGIANMYIQEFAARLEEAGGHLEIPDGSVSNSINYSGPGVTKK